MLVSGLKQCRGRLRGLACDAFTISRPIRFGRLPSLYRHTHCSTSASYNQVYLLFIRCKVVIFFKFFLFHEFFSILSRAIRGRLSSLLPDTTTLSLNVLLRTDEVLGNKWVKAFSTPLDYCLDNTNILPSVCPGSGWYTYDSVGAIISS